VEAHGDRAGRDPWRLALVALDQAFDGQAPLEALPVFAAVPAAARTMGRQSSCQGEVEVSTANG
jgi:hypothetical protein